MRPKLSQLIFSFKSITVFIISLSVSIINDLNAQQKKGPQFTVVHLPRKTGYSKAKLNEEIATANNKELVRKILKLKNFPPATIIIRIQTDSSHITWWTLNSSSKIDREDDNIILQSRNSTSLKFYRLSDFKNLFKDTLVLLDTLTIELFLHDEDYPEDKFFISYNCKAKKATIEKIPLEEWKLIFTKELFQACPDNFSLTKIYNENNPGRTLGSAYIRFLSEEQKEALLSFASFSKEANPSLKSKDIAFLTATYCSKTIGTPYFPQLTNWLEKNLSPDNNGND